MACLTLKRSHQKLMDCSPCSSSSASVDESPLIKRLRQSPSSYLACNTASSDFFTECNEQNFGATVSTVASLASSLSAQNSSVLTQSPLSDSFNRPVLSASQPAGISSSSLSPQSVFHPVEKNIENKKKSNGRLRDRLLAEVKRLERRGYCSKVSPSMLAKMAGVLTCATSSSVSMLTSPNKSAFSVDSSPPSTSQGVLLTLDQACLLCDQIWRERESELREEYNQILLDRLSEQFDAFAHRVEQLMQNRSSLLPPPSYVS